MLLDKTDFFDDTLVDEDIISQHLESDLDLLAATLGTIHILRKHLHSTKTYLNNLIFHKKTLIFFVKTKTLHFDGIFMLQLEIF